MIGGDGVIHNMFLILILLYSDGVLNRLGIGMGDDCGVGDEKNVNYDNYGVNVRSLTRIYNYGGSSYLS